MRDRNIREKLKIISADGVKSGGVGITGSAGTLEEEKDTASVQEDFNKPSSPDLTDYQTRSAVVKSKELPLKHINGNKKFVDDTDDPSLNEVNRATNVLSYYARSRPGTIVEDPEETNPKSNREHLQKLKSETDKLMGTSQMRKTGAAKANGTANKKENNSSGSDDQKSPSDSSNDGHTDESLSTGDSAGSNLTREGQGSRRSQGKKEERSDSASRKNANQPIDRILMSPAIKGSLRNLVSKKELKGPKGSAGKEASREKYLVGKNEIIPESKRERESSPPSDTRCPKEKKVEEEIEKEKTIFLICPFRMDYHKFPPHLGARISIQRRKWIRIQPKEVIYQRMSVFTILAVDDNKFILDSIKSYNTHLDCRIETAEDGSEAVKCYEAMLSKEMVFHLILMDVMMPNMDGCEATKEIRQREAKMKLPRTYIAGLSADQDAATMKRCLDSGMDEYLIKPLKLVKLKEIMDKLKGGY
eukprot:TRINITY_DN1406_c0_g1_i2.p1 TRINITY_DN1406_c0_g1~~TRINITY_DN1406_c0_g1_i2.p1  ORF type:complete len:474 (+),score=98.64 TRINITY_DN1406_c0_g1_i2:211-1632(+)